jgi:uncharacterized protein (TIGR02145 family)
MIACKEETAEPIARIAINSHVAYSGRIITVDASSSTDPDGDSFSLQVRWDFDDDGTWDTDYSYEQQLNWSFQGSGYHRIKLQVKDLDDLTSQAKDSIKIFGPFPDSVMIDPRDNQQYRIVKINGIWLMAENLRYGTRIPSPTIPTDNGIAEYYIYDDDPANFPVYGGLYNQYEALNYKMHTNNQGICPPGWRVPDHSDWELVNIDVVQYFIRDYYGPGGVSGFNMQFGGYYLDLPVAYQDNPSGFIVKGRAGEYWSTEYEMNESGIRHQGCAQIPNSFSESDFSWKGLTLFEMTDDVSNGKIFVRNYFLSVRCVHNSM